MQSFTTTIDRFLQDAKDYYIAGTFTLSFDRHSTQQLSCNSSPEDIEKALENLCTLKDIRAVITTLEYTQLSRQSVSLIQINYK